jgi:hypothetical protein
MTSHRGYITPEPFGDLWLGITAQAKQPHFDRDPGWPPPCPVNLVAERRHRQWLRAKEKARLAPPWRRPRYSVLRFSDLRGALTDEWRTYIRFELERSELELARIKAQLEWEKKV